MTLTPEFIENLKIIASRKCWQDIDNLCVADYAGDNYDDAYDGGYRSGEVCMAREVLSNLGIDW